MSNTEQKKRKPFSVIFLVIVIILLIAGYFYYKYKMPSHLMNMGKKDLEVKEYDKALKIFRYAQSQRPYDSEPVYYEVLTLSKMQPSSENLQKIYDISQYDDMDDAAALADTVLADIRSQIDKQAGSNYIDNVLFEDSLVRWNNNRPLTYKIVTDAPVPIYFPRAAERAFQEWQRAANGEFTFKYSTDNPDIIIHSVYSLPDDVIYTGKNASAVTIPDIESNKLKKMDIYVKSADTRIGDVSEDKIYGMLLHEIGHALGLGGHSALPDDVMYYDGDKISGETLPKNITARDLNTLNLLYKMMPDAVDSELSDEAKKGLLFHDIITSYPGENFEIETQRLIQELKQDTRNVPKWVDLAIRYGMKKQYGRSNYILEHILPLVTYQESNQFVIYYNMAVNSYRLKDYPLASRYLLMAEDLTRDKDTRVLDAFIDFKEKRTAQAKKKLKELKLDYPKDIEISVKLAEIYAGEKNLKETRQIIADLIRSNPDAVRDRRVMRYKGI